MLFQVRQSYLECGLSIAMAIPGTAKLPRVWTQYSHGYTRQGTGQGLTRVAEKGVT